MKSSIILIVAEIKVELKMIPIKIKIIWKRFISFFFTFDI